MVISLTGTVDTVPVIFTKTEDGLWETAVPPDWNDGTYIVELTATDDAGNQTFYIGKLFIWQRVVTCFRIIEQPYIHKLLSEKYIVNCNEGYAAKLLHQKIICVDRGDKLCIRLL